MKITLFQMNMKLGDLAYNLAHVKDVFSKEIPADTSVVVLPETWNLGFFPKNNLKEISKKAGEDSLLLLKTLSKKYHTHIVGGSIIKNEEEKVYNRSYILDKNGDIIGKYDKTHLFTYMNEDDYFAFGGHIETFTIEGVPCGIIICYDIRFLELVRTIALKGIKILFVVAQWPDARLEHWQLLTRVRAIENQIYVVAVNSCGSYDDITFAGHSTVISPWGEVLYEAKGEEEVKTIDIDLNKVDEIRSTINIYKDRRPDLYQL